MRGMSRGEIYYPRTRSGGGREGADGGRWQAQENSGPTAYEAKRDQNKTSQHVYHVRVRCRRLTALFALFSDVGATYQYTPARCYVSRVSSCDTVSQQQTTRPLTHHQRRGRTGGILVRLGEVAIEPAVLREEDGRVSGVRPHIIQLSTPSRGSVGRAEGGAWQRQRTVHSNRVAVER